jgi:hypothetical protein
MSSKTIRVGLAVTAAAFFTGVAPTSSGAEVGLNPPDCTPAASNSQGSPNGQTGRKECPPAVCDPITGICVQA